MVRRRIRPHPATRGPSVAKVELPRIFTIRESGHRILNPFDDTKLATLGRVIGLERDQQFLDLASGKGELLCTWARDHEIVGTGVDLHPPFVAAARARGSELGVSDRVTFVHDDASNWVAGDPVDVAACVGATWIGGGVQATMH
jgi:cyclopropane fatty-acyl-phospholipid synthase-like methyltransferase